MNRISALLDSLNTTEQWVFRLASLAVIIGCIGIGAITLSYFTYTTADFGGTYTEGMVGYPTAPNPILATASTDQSLSRLVYSGILRKTSWNSYQNDLGACQTSESGTDIVCTLSTNATFHDGEPVLADDVLYTIETIQKIGERSPWYPSLVGVTVSKRDARTVQFQLPKSFSGFSETLTVGIVPKHIWVDIPVSEIESHSTLESMMIGSGPYMVNRHTSSADHIKSTSLSAFSDYVLGSPFISTIKLNYFQSNDNLIASFNKDKLDGIVLESEDVEMASQLNKDYKRVPIVHPDIYGVMTRSSLQQEKKHLTELSDYLLYHNLSEYGYPWGKVLPPWNTQELLDFSNPHDTLPSIGNKNKVSSTSPLPDSPRALVTVDQDSLIRLTTTISKALNAIGLPVEMRVFDFSGFKNSVVPKRAFNFLVFGQRYRHISDAYAYWNSSERLDPGLNVTETVNSQIDTHTELLARGGQEYAASHEVYNKLNNRIQNEHVFLPLFLDRDVYIFNPKKTPIHQPLIYNPTVDRFNSVHTWYLHTTLEFKQLYGRHK